MDIHCNERPSMNKDIVGALFTLSLLILNSRCKDGASDVNLHRKISFIFKRSQ